ncbi:MAG: glycoside hydrolase family 32 protein, partial [bacterium]|nr:glycoside hydrolase family 32 protein [bacterium]
DSFMGAEDLYREPMRPQFHFSPRRGWNNDPNGLVYYKGEYHLYFQHNPYGWNWGNMHWGHAVSTDLVHWEELPIAIYPAEFGDWAFSGGALVDVANTGGFKTGDEDVIVAAYTSTGRGESIAFSNDRGRTFTDYEGNPVVKHQGRDPKIIWYEPGGHWSMAVYDERDGKRGIAFHTSPDLKAWTYQSWIDGYYECPEIFPLAVDGNPDQVKWVVYGADGDYSIGAFDGKTFTAESGKHKGNCGNCFYASQTFSDLPAEDGRRIQIGWGRVATPGMPFNQMMLFPCVLTLRTTDDGVRMFTEPVGEIENVHEKVHELQDVTLKPGENPLSDISGDLFDVELAISMGEASAVALTVRGTTVRYDAKAQTLSCGDCEAPVRMRDGMVDLRVLVDRTTVEIFANGGEVYMPVGVMAKGDEVSLAAEGSACTVTHMKVAELRSAWK